MPFLSIVTRRHPARPGLWKRHLASLARQTCRDFEHVTVPGGESMYEANRSLYLHRQKVSGDYVLILDDDDRISDPEALQAIRDAVESRPGVLFVRMLIDGKQYPTEWESQPRRRCIGSSCFVVRRDLWQRHIRFWAQPRAGDYYFIRSVMKSDPSVVWLDRVCSETMRVSNGTAENGDPAPVRRPTARVVGGPRLVCIVPFSPDGDLGRAYNESMDLIGPDDWAVFLDHDAMFLSGAWHGLISAVIAEHPRAGLLTATTNRIGNAGQLDRSVTSHDVKSHRLHASVLESRWGATTTDVTTARTRISGVVLATPRRAWEAVKEANGTGFVSGLLGVDNTYHRDVARAGYEVRVCRGLYVYHWYRGDGDRSHLQNGRKVTTA